MPQDEQRKIVYAYQAHSGLTYGEITDVFIRHLIDVWCINKNTVFVDVGSGIGQACCMVSLTLAFTDIYVDRFVFMCECVMSIISIDNEIDI